MSVIYLAYQRLMLPYVERLDQVGENISDFAAVGTFVILVALVLMPNASVTTTRAQLQAKIPMIMRFVPAHGRGGRHSQGSCLLDVDGVEQTCSPRSLLSGAVTSRRRQISRVPACCVRNSHHAPHGRDLQDPG